MTVTLDAAPKSQPLVDEEPRFKAIKILKVPVGFRPNYQVATDEDLLKEWRKLRTAKKRAEAIHVLEVRLSNRGRSYNGLQVLMALIAAVEVAIVVFNVDKGLLDMKAASMGWGAIIASFGLIALAIGILPVKKEVFPRRRKDEGMDAIQKVKNLSFDFFMELRSRSTTQRHILWRSRLWFGISCTLMIISLLVVNGAIASFTASM